MRVLILSDLHLGEGSSADIFWGTHELIALLGSAESDTDVVIVNGDVFDFLLNARPLDRGVADATTIAEGFLQHEPTSEVLAAFGRFATAGRKVVFRAGNHDVELGLPAVQEVIRRGMGAEPDVTFVPGDQATSFTVAGVEVCLAHGEEWDDWNRVDHHGLRTDPASFRYPPGSELVKEVLNPLKMRGLRFVDLLKPDFRGAVLAGLAIDPGAIREALKPEVARLVGRLVLRAVGAVPSSPEPDLGLGDVIDAAGLDADEAQELAAAIDPDGVGALGVSEALGRARIKIAKAALALYARLYRSANASSAQFFEIEPGADEWTQVASLRVAHPKARVFILGHSHAARFEVRDATCYVNTGTWIGLVRTPAATDDSATWAKFLGDLDSDPALTKGTIPVFGRFTACRIEPGATGALVTLVEYTASNPQSPLAAALIPEAE